MLAHILAVLVGTGSVGLYIAAFFFPEIHRKQDFIWSGVGFFYALSLWIYARQTTGGVLVGETASVALIGWFVWQTLQLRRQLVPTNQQTPIPSTSKIKQQLGLKPTDPIAPKAPPKSKQPVSMPEPVAPTPSTIPTTPIPVDVTASRSQPKPQTLVPPAQSAPNVRVPVEVRVERQPQQPPTAVPPISTPAVPSVVRATISTPVAVPVEPKQPQPPPTVPTIPPEENEAWIKLEVKSSSPTPSKPIGQATKPPTTAPTQSAANGLRSQTAIAAESVDRTAPTDTPTSTPKSDAESSYP
jgi:Ycf66 protein N-terminus